MDKFNDPLWHLMGSLFRAHPWHGVSIGPNAPYVVTAFVELTPTDTVKYELDKETGILRVDRPQRFSNVCPALYGLVPQTYCGESTARYSMEKSGKTNIIGDDDPLDICILTEKNLSTGNVLVDAIPIGGLRMLDGNEADDKIIAVMKDDVTYGAKADIRDCPRSLIDRLKHYFLTYKQMPDQSNECEITHVYSRDEALDVIRFAQIDYQSRFSNIKAQLTQTLRNESHIPDSGGPES